MGNSIWKRVLGKKEKRILILGLDASGKTTTLYMLKLGGIVTTIPTIGFNVESISHNGVNIMAWDVGGREKIRPLYRHYYQNTEGLVYVIDANDRERYAEAVDEMTRITEEDELRNVPILVLANKQDLPNAMSPHEMANKLFDSKYAGLNNRPIAVFGVSASDKNHGLLQAFDWLTKALTDLNLQPRQYVQDWKHGLEETNPSSEVEHRKSSEVEHRKSCGLLQSMKSFMYRFSY